VRSQHSYTPMSSISAPLWPLVLLTAILPALRWWRRTKRSRWQAIGACQRCGYDLTGNVSGACPECGAEAPPVPCR
jgi:hypothetical protein